jgi:hypothetical protein
MIDQLLQPEVQRFIKDHQNDDPFLLSLISRGKNDFPLGQAIQQIQSYQKGRKKLPSWASCQGIIWPPPLSVEQASSEATARFKASLAGGQTMADLTGGMGVDAYYISNSFREAHYVEPDAQLCEVAKHNFVALGKSQISIHCMTAEAFLEESTEKFDLIYLDPSRRSKSSKVFKIEDCSPDLFKIISQCLGHGRNVLVKLSPMLDLKMLMDAFNPSLLWIVSVKNEVKEILILLESESKEPVIRAIDLDSGGDILSEFAFKPAEESDAQSEFSYPLKYLYEPGAAILKSGAFKFTGQRYAVKKLHQHTHLYTSNLLISDFPGRIFSVQKQVKPSKKEIRRLFPEGQVNVITRNYPLNASTFKKKFGLMDGGEDYLICTTLMGGEKAGIHAKRLE